MPFQYILANLLAATDATGVLFVDGTGETVDVACADDSPYEMRLLGAYLGIHMRRVGTVLEEQRCGAPELFHVERSRLHLFAMPLPDDYYLVLVQRRPTIAARARATLRRAAEELRTALFS